jgi:hypothetical protein
MKFDIVELVTATGASGSKIFDASFMVNLSAVATSTADEAGVLKFQASNDRRSGPTDTGSAITNWVDIPSATVNITAGGGPYLIPKFDVSHSWIKMIYTHSSGSGSVTARAKSVGF